MAGTIVANEFGIGSNSVQLSKNKQNMRAIFYQQEKLNAEMIQVNDLELFWSQIFLKDLIKIICVHKLGHAKSFLRRGAKF